MNRLFRNSFFVLLASSNLLIASCAHSAKTTNTAVLPKVIENDVPLVKPLSRATLVVSDLESALDLFQGILKLEIKTDLTISGAPVNELLGTEGKTVRIVILSSGGSEIANIGLLTYVGADAASNTPRPAIPSSFDLGQVALVMDTTNIYEVEKAVKKAGYPIISSPMVIFDRPNMLSQSQEMLFIGPEGIALNLIQQGIPAGE